MASPRSPSVLSLFALAALFPGCFLDAGPIDAAGAGAASPGAGGSGAAAATTGGAGGTASDPTTGGGGPGGAGGTGGGATTTTTDTTPPPCGVDSDCPSSTSMCLAPKCDKATGTCSFKNANDGAGCPDPPTPPDACHVAECKAGACVLVQLPENTVVDDTKNKDCKKYVCDATGTVVAKPDDGDKPDSNECTTGSCQGGNPVVEPDSEGADCLASTGACCKGTCCVDFLGFTCVAAGCCPDIKVCGDDCCSAFQTCFQGKCVGF